MAPLLTRLKYYTGNTYVMRLSRKLDRDRESNLVLEAVRLRSREYPYPSWSQALAEHVLGRASKARHCFQHVANLLDQARLCPVDNGRPLASNGLLQVCRDVCNLAGRELPDGYTYESPVEIVYNLNDV